MGIDSNQEIPLEQRGDGVQSQYLLSVLRHMCFEDRKYHIWAFEEPENSLEYSRVKMLSSNLEDDSNESQIFLTTHSPALVNMDSEKARAFRVYQDDENASAVTPLSEFDNESGLQTDIGIGELKADLYEDYKNQLDKIEALEKRAKKLKQINSHKVLTEGKTDVFIINTAFKKLKGTKPSFEVKEANPYSEDRNGSAGGAGMLAKFVETTWSSNQYKTIAVFDRDNEGTKEFEGLSRNCKLFKGRNEVKKHDNDSAYAILLPIPEFRNEEDQICIEKLCSNETLNRKTDEGKGLTLKKPEPAVIRLNNGQKKSISKNDIKTEALENVLGNDIEIDAGKSLFANKIVPHLEKEEFDEFNKLFRLIEDILKD